MDHLVAEKAIALPDWKKALEPAGRSLLPALAAALENSKWAATQRRTIIELYADFARGKDNSLAPLEHRLPDGHERDVLSVEFAKGKANIAAALVKFDRGDRVWPLLAATADRTLRSYLIERLGTSGVSPKFWNIGWLRKRVTVNDAR